jgi:uncharacterized protein (UPF0212 family)
MKKIKDLILEIKVPNSKDPCHLEEIAIITICESLSNNHMRVTSLYQLTQ